MKNKSMIFGAISGVCALLLILCMCLPVWGTQLLGSATETTYGLWAEFSDFSIAGIEFSSTWATIASVCTTVALAGGVLIAVLGMLSATKVGKNKLTKLLILICSLVVLVSAILATVSVICFPSVNTETIANRDTGITALVWAILIPVFSGLSGLFGVLCGVSVSKAKAKGKRKK